MVRSGVAYSPNIQTKAKMKLLEKPDFDGRKTDRELGN